MRKKYIFTDRKLHILSPYFVIFHIGILSKNTLFYKQF